MKNGTFAPEEQNFNVPFSIIFSKLLKFYVKIFFKNIWKFELFIENDANF